MSVQAYAAGPKTEPVNMEIVDGVPHILNGTIPSSGVEILELKEQWRIGGDDDEILLGVIVAALNDDDGNVYLLDNSLTQVNVFSPEGEFLRAISRNGEGPGEVNHPIHMLWMPDGALGIVQGYPGKIVKVNRKGDPMGTVSSMTADPSAGGFIIMRDAYFRNGIFAVCGERMTMSDEGFDRSRFLALWDLDGTETIRLLETNVPSPLGQPRYIEKDEYFVYGGRWTLGPDGRIYAAPERDFYSINVYKPDGSLERVIKREFTSWTRTPEEKAFIGPDMNMVVNGEVVEFEREVEDRDPCITNLRVFGTGELWVYHSFSGHDQPPGILQTYDIFDAEGLFWKQVAIAVPGDAQNDLLIWTDDRHAILIKGAGSGQAPGDGSGDEGDAEDGGEPIEIIYYSR
ncbi:MAG: hypothetical protein KJ970_08800 [Candidatus Eisenbacteria bacterium]|uniref:6-bladed beta-propeller n=1 Tax=Eiseniibacteriota bacterium TaxID=2212470 RepID=A0A948W6D7_UNCEI|nr:hypothetical protein [Candidatus Eisenbacteria bacterium]MBU1951255.1 hypothetical protein [Candidatus Eisenbacteria bacterium]MBU2691015.1 hypothetical protein [Candidatus Eisenbacteria bacterium]